MLCCLGTFKCNLRRNQLQCAQSKPRGPTQCDTWYEYEWRPQQHQHLISKYIKMRQWQPKTRPIRACIERQQQQQQQQMQLQQVQATVHWPVASSHLKHLNWARFQCCCFPWLIAHPSGPAGHRRQRLPRKFHQKNFSAALVKCVIICSHLPGWLWLWLPLGSLVNHDV